MMFNIQKSKVGQFFDDLFAGKPPLWKQIEDAYVDSGTLTLPIVNLSAKFSGDVFHRCNFFEADQLLHFCEVKDGKIYLLEPSPNRLTNDKKHLFYVDYFNYVQHWRNNCCEARLVVHRFPRKQKELFNKWTESLSEYFKSMKVSN